MSSVKGEDDYTGGDSYLVLHYDHGEDCFNDLLTAKTRETAKQ